MTEDDLGQFSLERRDLYDLVLSLHIFNSAIFVILMVFFVF